MKAVMQPSPFEKASVSYLEFGPVVPLEFGAKRPAAGVTWKGAAALTTVAGVGAYLHQRLNIGLRLDKFLVVDVDGEEGLRSLAKLEAQIGILPRDVVQHSGGGGFHIFFRIDKADMKRIRTRHPAYPRIDFKAGEGHILVMAPSIHPNGRPYRWAESSRSLGEAPEAPRRLLETLSQAKGDPLSEGEFQHNGREGQRHHMMISNGLKLINQGWSLDSVREALWQLVNNFHDRWSDDEAFKEIEGAMNWFAKLENGALVPKTATPFDIAAFLAPNLRGLLVQLDNGDWFVRDAGVFKFSRREEVRPILIKAIQPTIQDFETWIEHQNDNEVREKAESKLSKLKSLSWTDKALEALAANRDFRVQAKDLDPPYILNFQNGAFYLDGTPAPHAICTKQMNIKYDPQAKQPDLFDTFLAWALSPESGATLMEAVASCLRGERNSQNLWFIEGPAAAGKSVMMGVLHDIFGSYAVAPDTSLIFERKSQSGATNEDLYSLRGARFAVFSEGPEGLPLNAARIKSLTSGDTLSARQVYGHATHFENVAELFMMTNHETNLNVDDSGVRRRIKRILFKKTVAEADRNEKLKSYLVAEGSGILNRLLALVPRIESEGIQISNEILDDTRQLFERQDIMGQFVLEKIRPDLSGSVKGSTLYRAYQTWCVLQGITSKTTVQFYRNFEAKVAEAQTYSLNGTKAYRGVCLKEPI